MRVGVYARKATAAAVIALVLMAGSGCAYLKDRGNDLSDVIEAGVTITPRATPTFALRWNAFNVFSFGYSDSDLTMYGWTDRNVGKLHLRDEFWGVFAWGEEKIAIWPAGDDGPTPLGTWPPATSLPLECREPYTVGFVGAFAGSPRPPSRTYGECPKLIQLGWVGVYANCSLIDLADFVVGWTTVDLGGDDTACLQAQ